MSQTPFTAFVEFEIRTENTTAEHWVARWAERALDAWHHEPETLGSGSLTVTVLAREPATLWLIAASVGSAPQRLAQPQTEPLPLALPWLAPCGCTVPRHGAGVRTTEPGDAGHACQCRKSCAKPLQG